MGKLKERRPEKGKKLKTPSDSKPLPQFSHPVFCFRFLVENYGLDQCDKNEKSALIVKLHSLSQRTWQDIKFSGRHDGGSEKINRCSFKATIPDSVPKDVDLYALRFSGKKPIIGFKSDFIFHILFIDNKFNVYKHS
jgi:hypothetical protein